MEQITLQNQYLKLSCINYGAIIKELIVKDKNENEVNVIIGFKKAEDYLNNPYYLGAAVGRFAGRIGNGGFTVEGNHYSIYNENGVHLHGGKNNFSHKYWKIEKVEKGENPYVTFSYLSEDMEEGYPGNLQAFVTYKLEKNKLTIRFEAVADCATIVNLTNHNYYNLNGGGSILQHELQLDADSFLETDEKQIATGKFLDVKGTPFDFISTRNVGDHSDFKGIDDCFVLNKKGHIATLHSKESGIEMKVSTNQPGVVIFTPDQLPEANYYNYYVDEYSSICFETQNFPDAPNKPHFPSAELKKGEKYINESEFEFSVR
ncbi:aldose epimerase family protein [Abyssalbus ytuae]|uniref:Galactose mutarotase n=1 Tax=Abyssalbus ytuae TaxID=2926907 RepID=A0A9E6ZSG2_9FLAO|nr:aldose epimerase family protein [Abyssalbus ytuae]UOB18018.1 galactose mutarotase [Abyssalbus ytuae]